MDIETRRKISRSMKGKSNFEGKKHTHATKLQIGFSQEGHRNVKDHKWVTDKETGEEHRVKGNKPKGTRWGRSRSSFQEAVDVWDKPNPVKKSTKLSTVMKARAKARAKAAGRTYPNMVDNIWAAKNEEAMNEAKATKCGRCGTTHVRPQDGGTCPALTKAQNAALREGKEIPFEGPYTTIKPNVKDKSGAVHTPMSRARNLARMALASKKKKEQTNKVVSEVTVDVADIEKKKAITSSDKNTIGKLADLMKKEKEKKEVKEASIYSSAMHGRGKVGMTGKKPNASDMATYGKYNVTVKHEGGEKTYKLKGMKDSRHASNVASKLHAKENPGSKIKDVSYVKEQAIDEVSKQTLGRYIEKAATSMSTAAFGQGQASASRRPPSESDQKTGMKRMTGIARATSKLTKEESETNTMSPVTERICALLSKKIVKNT